MTAEPKFDKAENSHPKEAVRPGENIAVAARDAQNPQTAQEVRNKLAETNQKSTQELTKLGVLSDISFTDKTPPPAAAANLDAKIGSSDHPAEKPSPDQPHIAGTKDRPPPHEPTASVDKAPTRELSSDRAHESREATETPPRSTDTSADLQKEHDQLLEHAKDKHMSPEQLKKFEDNMKVFEARAQKDNLSPEEQLRFYKNVDKLLDTDDNRLPSKQDNIVLAEQVMQHAATPTGVDQGQHSTCTTAALESNIFTKDPADAAAFITDAIRKDSPYKLDPSILTRDKEALENPLKDGDRDYAGQIFQGTAVSIEIAKRIPGAVYSEGSKGEPAATGEFVTFPDGTKEAFGSKKADGLNGNEVLDANQIISGGRNHLEYLQFVPGIDPTTTEDINGGLQTTVHSEQGLKDELTRLQKEHKLPVLIWVDSSREPFRTASDGGAAGGSGAGHFVNITGYDSTTGKVTIDNQWGSKADIEAPISQLAGAMDTYDPKRQHPTDGSTETSKEFQELSKKYATGPMTDERRKQMIGEYTDEMAKAEKRWGHTAEAASLEKLSQEWKAGKISEKDYVKKMTDCMGDIDPAKLDPKGDESKGLQEAAYMWVFELGR